jgi:hypothetical protein
MADISFSSPVVVNRYDSIGSNLVPKPGILTIDASSILTLSENNSIILQKPISELQSIQSHKLLGIFRTITATIYVGPNEAYRVLFLSGEPALDGGAETYDALLKGNDMQETIQEFKANRVELHDKTLRKHASQKLYKNYTDFMALSKQAGVYKPVRKTLKGFVGILFPVIIIALFVWVFITSRR